MDFKLPLYNLFISNRDGIKYYLLFHWFSEKDKRKVWGIMWKGEDRWADQKDDGIQILYEKKLHKNIPGVT